MKLQLEHREQGKMQIEISLGMASLDYMACLGATGSTSLRGAGGFRYSPTSSSDSRLVVKLGSKGVVVFVASTNLSVEFNRECHELGHFRSGKEYGRTGMKALCCGIPFDLIWHDGMHAATRVLLAAVVGGLMFWIMLALVPLTLSKLNSQIILHLTHNFERTSKLAAGQLAIKVLLFFSR